MKNVRRLLLHVGPHKTGSTAIQIGLEKQAAEIASFDWTFMRFESMQGGAHRLADLLSADRLEEAAPYMDQLKDATGKTVVSSENFSRLKEAQAQAFLEAIGFDEVRVVYYLRNPLNRLKSAWRERVKHGYRYTFVEFIAGRLSRPFNDVEINDALKIKPWVNAVGTSFCDIHLYDEIEDVAKHFFSIYFPDVQVNREGTTNRVNRSFSAEKTEVLRALSGCQTHLLNNRSYDQHVDNLCNSIKQISENQKINYTRKFTLSLNSAIMMRIERMLMDEFSNSLKLGKERDHIFHERTVTWEYLAPEIWLEQPNLTKQLFEFRTKLLAELGVPIFDQRLRNL